MTYTEIKKNSEHWISLNNLKCTCGAKMKLWTIHIAAESAEIGCTNTDFSGSHLFLTLEIEKD